MEELVKRLWECASGECFNCSQYTETTNASVCSKELMKQAADAIEALSKPKWIPVTEQLPEPYTWVLVSAEKHEVAFDAFYDGTQWKDAVLNGLIVTHWMPLPEPPEEGE